MEGRDFEAQLFALDKPSYEGLFEFRDDLETKTVGSPHSIILNESNLEVDVFGKLNFIIILKQNHFLKTFSFSFEKILSEKELMLDIQVKIRQHLFHARQDSSKSI